MTREQKLECTIPDLDVLKKKKTLSSRGLTRVKTRGRLKYFSAGFCSHVVFS